MVQGTTKRQAAALKGKSKKPQTFVIDCTKPVDDKIMEIGTFEKYLRDKIKINNKTGWHPTNLSVTALAAYMLRVKARPRAQLRMLTGLACRQLDR